MANESPCRYCVAPDRYLGCHADCEKYKKAKQLAHEKTMAKYRYLNMQQKTAAYEKFMKTGKLPRARKSM